MTTDLDRLMAEFNRNITNIRNNEDTEDDKELILECFRDIFIVLMEIRKEIATCQKQNE